MNWMTLVLQRWKDDGVALNAPASTVELLQLASIIGGNVPKDFEALYRVANGMADDAMDGWNVSLWSVARILREQDTTQDGKRRWTAFADVLINSWFFRLCAQGGRTLVLVEGTQEVFESLPDFFDAYANRPESLNLVARSG